MIATKQQQPEEVEKSVLVVKLGANNYDYYVKYGNALLAVGTAKTFNFSPRKKEFKAVGETYKNIISFESVTPRELVTTQ